MGGRVETWVCMLVVDFTAQRFEFPALLLAFHPANFGTAAGFGGLALGRRRIHTNDTKTQASIFPPNPRRRKGYDGWGGGCADCELRIYLRELAEWKKLEAALKNTRHDTTQKPAV